MMSVERVVIFWVVIASSGEKSCLQFSIPTGSGAGGEGDVSHSFKPTALLVERVQNISIYPVYIDIFCTRSAKRAVGSRAVTPSMTM